MLPKRVIPCLDVEGGQVVKGVNFVDRREMGDPVELARHYADQGADELVFLDISATPEERSPMVAVAERTAANVFIPFTVGGGIRSADEVQELLDAGADRVAVNSAILRDPPLLNGLAARFGRSCIVAAVDVKQEREGEWEVYAAGGGVPTGREAVAWAREAAERGAGEILLTSIDRDGTGTGYDLAITRQLTDELSVPVIASGGAGRLPHYAAAIQDGGAEAVLAASQLHNGELSVGIIKGYLTSAGVAVRPARPTVKAKDKRPTPDGPPATIGIVDYGVGNRRSLEQALRRVGASPMLTDRPAELAGADGLVLPGVGAFVAAMEQLDERGLTGLLRELALAGKPLLGICLGEQLLFEGSEEDGWRPGLGLLPGKVQEIASPIRPNIGWREVSLDADDGLFNGLGPQEYFYHLHQYAALADSGVVGRTPMPYESNSAYDVATVVRRGNVYGTQFHPEKSGASGLRLLRNFVDLCVSGQTSLQ